MTDLPTELSSPAATFPIPCTYRNTDSQLTSRHPHRLYKNWPIGYTNTGSQAIQTLAHSLCKHWLRAIQTLAHRLCKHWLTAIQIMAHSHTNNRSQAIPTLTHRLYAAQPPSLVMQTLYSYPHRLYLNFGPHPQRLYKHRVRPHRLEKHWASPSQAIQTLVHRLYKHWPAD